MQMRRDMISVHHAIRHTLYTQLRFNSGAFQGLRSQVKFRNVALHQICLMHFHPVIVQELHVWKKGVAIITFCQNIILS